MNIIKTKVTKPYDKETKKPILQISIQIEIEKLFDVQKKLGKPGTDEIFEGLLKKIKEECRCI